MALFPELHFYSPYADPAYVEKHKNRIYHTDENLHGIRISECDIFLEHCGELNKIFPYHPDKNEQHRYHYKNGFYERNDALILQRMLHSKKPNRIIEVGSGFSSAFMLDERDRVPELANMQLTFIEPNPQRLNSLLKRNDKQNTTIMNVEVQDVDITIFDQLKENDILFIDSSHVTKAGNDLNFLMFEVLPRLHKNVYIHFHDIFYPFEYPMQWVKEKRGWNEAYLLRAFLMYNKYFEVVFFNDYMIQVYREKFEKYIPGLLLPSGNGGNLWIKTNTLRG